MIQSSGAHHRFQKLLLLALLSLVLQLQLHSTHAEDDEVHDYDIPTVNMNETNPGEGRNPHNETVQDIRGGTPSPPLSYYGVFAQTSSVCGAALIHGDLAITAAHCVANSAPGALRFNSDRRTSGGTLVSVIGKTLHPGWSGSIVSADLAILKLANFTSLTPVTLNQDGAIPLNIGDRMGAAGFGVSSDTSGVSDILLGTEIPYLGDCTYRLGENFVLSRMICGDSTVKATCGGDSGSPIVIPGTKTQIGINSYSNGGCNSQTLDVYTRVSTYYHWIQTQICDQSSNPPLSCFNATLPPTPGPTPGTPRPTPPPVAPRPTCFWQNNWEGEIRNAISNFWADNSIDEKFPDSENEDP